MSDHHVSAESTSAAATSGGSAGGPPAHHGSTRGIRLVVFGTLIAVFAPLAGFLGGTMVGSTGSVTELDPLFVWLFLGLMVGGVGAILAIVGGLRWVRANHES